MASPGRKALRARRGRRVCKGCPDRKALKGRAGPPVRRDRRASQDPRANADRKALQASLDPRDRKGRRALPARPDLQDRTAQGEKGPVGERGAPGAAGAPGLQIGQVRQDCTNGSNCTVTCNAGEIALNAVCPGGTPALRSPTLVSCGSANAAPMIALCAH